MKLINGKKIAKDILSNLSSEIKFLSVKPRLVIIQVGNDDASNLYVSRKIEDAAKVGIETSLEYFRMSSYQQIRDLVTRLNHDPLVHGYFIQLPFPLEENAYDLFNMIDPIKDVDGLNAQNLGRIWQGNDEAFYPATVLAVIECLKYVAGEMGEKFDDYLQSKNIVIINHSVIVGKPLAGYFIAKNATVTVAHKYTSNLSALTQKADIVISATGKKGLIDNTMVKDDAVLIDVGISRTEEGVFGDIAADTFVDTNVWLTPVPEGVGPLTRAFLLVNTLKACKLQNS